jgi:hypothetical protein
MLEVIELLENEGYDIDIKQGKSVVPSKIQISMLPNWKDKEHQVAAIKYLSEFDNPIRALSLQTGCLAEDEMVHFYIHGDMDVKCTIGDAYRYFHKLEANDWDFNIPAGVKSWDNTNRCFCWNQIEDIVYSGIKQVFKLSLENGRTIKVTEDHPIMTDYGYIELRDLIRSYKVLCVKDTEPGFEYSHIRSVESAGKSHTYDICCKKIHNFVANGIVVHNSGKTYCAIKAICNIGYRALILTLGLEAQWSKAISDQTGLVEPEIFTLKGYPSIVKLYKHYELGFKPSIVIASLMTMRNYLKNQGNYKSLKFDYQKFMDTYGFGTKVLDECHENFHNNTLLDLYNRIPINIYLSATYHRNDPVGKRVFDHIFSPDIKFGEDTYKRFVKTTFYNYSIDLGTDKYHTPKGYSHFKYEKRLFHSTRNFTKFIVILELLLNCHFINIRREGQKALVFLSKVESINDVVIRLRQKIPNLKIRAYVSETDEDVLHTSDIIVSTPGSCGTGKDISGLRCVINTISFESYTRTKQMIGRLRELSNGDVPEMVDLANVQSSDHQRHAIVRQSLWRALSKWFNIQDLFI